MDLETWAWALLFSFGSLYCFGATCSGLLELVTNPEADWKSVLRMARWGPLPILKILFGP